MQVNAGDTVNVAGTIHIWADGTPQLDGGTIIADTIDHTHGGAFNFAAGRLTVGLFQGDLDNQGGTLAPDTSPGSTHVSGNYTINAGTFEVDLAGNGGVSGTDFDQLTVNNTATLGGTLDIAVNADSGTYADQSTPGDSDTFVVLTAGTRVGNFAAVIYDNSPLTADFGTDGNGLFRDHVGGGLFRIIDYTATEVMLTNLLALLGDADGDKDGDITDFNTLASNFDPSGNNSATNDWTTADFDADHDVDITDFGGLSSNFAPGGYGATSIIPEPSSVVLLLLGLGCVMFLCCSRS